MKRNACWDEFVESKDSITPPEIHVFFFSKTEVIDWQKPNKEFLYEGNFYDIIDQQDNDSGTVMRCKMDLKEKVIVESFYGISKDHHAIKVNSGKTSFVYICKESTQDCLSSINKIRNRYLYINHFKSNDLKTWSPPPELLQF